MILMCLHLPAGRDYVISVEFRVTWKNYLVKLELSVLFRRAKTSQFFEIFRINTEVYSIHCILYTLLSISHSPYPMTSVDAHQIHSLCFMS